MSPAQIALIFYSYRKLLSSLTLCNTSSFFTKFAQLIFSIHISKFLKSYAWSAGSRERSVDIATRYELDGPGIESLWEARFSAPVQTGAVSHPTSYTMGTGSFPGLKRPGCGFDQRPSSSAEVEGRVELYICSSSGSSWPVLGWNFILFATCLPKCPTFRTTQSCAPVVAPLQFRP